MTQYDLGKVVGEDGAKGDDGNGIASITKTGTSGLVDTYTITFTNGSTTTLMGLLQLSLLLMGLMRLLLFKHHGEALPVIAKCRPRN